MHVQFGEGLFEGTPRCRGYGAECFELREKLCAEEVDMRTKGGSSVKGHTGELGAGLNVRGCQSE